jgi:hypothetical protein
MSAEPPADADAGDIYLDGVLGAADGPSLVSAA